MSDRTKRLKALGNAVVPQVAEWIARQIIDSTKALPPAQCNAEQNAPVAGADQ